MLFNSRILWIWPGRKDATLLTPPLTCPILFASNFLWGSRIRAAKCMRKHRNEAFLTGNRQEQFPRQVEVCRDCTVSKKLRILPIGTTIEIPVFKASISPASVASLFASKLRI